MKTPQMIYVGMPDDGRTGQFLDASPNWTDFAVKEDAVMVGVYKLSHTIKVKLTPVQYE